MATCSRLALLSVLIGCGFASALAETVKLDITSFNLSDLIRSCGSSLPGSFCELLGAARVRPREGQNEPPTIDPLLHVRTGDRVEINLVFNTHERLEMMGNANQEVFQVYFLGGLPGETYALSNVSFELLALQGSPLQPFVPSPGFQGLLGPSFVGDYVAAGEFISFGGFRTVFDVSSMSMSNSFGASSLRFRFGAGFMRVAFICPSG